MDGGAGSFPEVECRECETRYVPSSEAVLKAHLVLGGEGWTLRDFYIQGGLIGFMPDSGRVDITSLESFVARANNGRL